MKFKELADEEWEFIKPFLPKPAPTGRLRADDRKTINDILFVLIMGCKWADMPSSYGSSVTVWRRLKSWQEKDIWDVIAQTLKNKAYVEDKISIDAVAIDSKTITAKKGANVSDTMAIKRRKAPSSM